MYGIWLQIINSLNLWISHIFDPANTITHSWHCQVFHCLGSTEKSFQLIPLLACPFPESPTYPPHPTSCFQGLSAFGFSYVLCPLWMDNLCQSLLIPELLLVKLLEDVAINAQLWSIIFNKNERGNFKSNIRLNWRPSLQQVMITKLHTDTH